MDERQLGYRSNSQCYMLTYRGVDIGGAGVRRGTPKPHGRAVQSNREHFRKRGELALRAILEGRGQQRFLEAIARIDEDEGDG